MVLVAYNAYLGVFKFFCDRSTVSTPHRCQQIQSKLNPVSTKNDNRASASAIAAHAAATVALAQAKTIKNNNREIERLTQKLQVLANSLGQNPNK